MERDIIAERTKAGLAAARRRRVQLGQPKVRDAKNLARAKRLRKSGRSLRYIAGLLDCSMRELLGYREKSP